MAYRIDPNDGSIIVDGFEAGIGDSPYATQVDVTGYRAGGLMDMRNINIISIPGEGSVAFSTSNQTLASFSGSVTAANSGNNKITYGSETGTPVSGMALVFASLSGGMGISSGSQSASTDTNVYWISNIDTNAKTFIAYTDPLLSSVATITGTGTGTFATINMGAPTYVDFVTGQYWVDTNGRAWGLRAGIQPWTFLGNTTRTNGNGNGVVTYAGYLFVYRNAAIDYTATSSISWVYGWTPANGSSGGTAMQTAGGTNNPHQPVLGGSDNSIYYPDGNAVGKFFQITGQIFNPTSTSTYTYSQLALILSPSEVAQCVAVLGTNLLVGGNRNIAYSWDRTSSGYSPIYIAENLISRIVTVNTNAYLFAGNRGRIYITNGSQAVLFKKIPDHLSNTVEPYYTWGGATSTKNQLYFGVSATDNSGVAINQYGGLWGIDLDTKATRLVSQLSYGTYAGLATAIAAIGGTAAGFGLYIGWNSGASTYGIDTSTSTPYTGGQSYITSDLIPVGTFVKKKTFTNVEYKLSVPLVAGESVQLLAGSTLAGSFTSCGTDSTIGALSNNFALPIQSLQWLKLQAILTSTGSSPSYVRLKELRIY